MKYHIPLLSLFCLLLLCACGKNAPPEPQTRWDCSVTCAQESTDDSYVITYSDTEIISTTGALTFTNRNTFEITLHLLADGQEERSYVMSPRGVCTLSQIQRDIAYRVGCHADVAADTDICLTVHDGEGSFPP